MKKTLLALSLALTLLVPVNSEAMALKSLYNDLSDTMTGFFTKIMGPNTTPSREINKLTDPPSYTTQPNCEKVEGPVASTEQFDGNRYTPAGKPTPVPTPEFSVADSDKELYENFMKVGGDPLALRQALCFKNRFGSSTFKSKGDPAHSGGIRASNQRYITINDLNKRSDVARMYVLDMETGKVEAYFSAHGEAGSAGTPANNPYRSEYYSNTSGSKATPRGFFVTGDTYVGKYGNSLRLHGLQSGINDNSFVRAVVMHGFNHMNPVKATSDDANPMSNVNAVGNVALSQGCTMLEPSRAQEVIGKIKAKSSSGGSLYYNYTQEEKALGEDYCGETNLMIK